MNKRFHLPIQTETIRQRQTVIKSELDEIEAESGIRERAKAVMEKLSGMQDSLDPQGLIDRYILAMSGLHLEGRFRVYSDLQIKRLVKQAEAVLSLLKSNLKESRLAFLAGDYYRIRSKLQFRNGEHLGSNWRLCQAEYFTGKGRDDAVRRLNDSLGLALRDFRLGQLNAAKQRFQTLWAEDIPRAQKMRAGLGLAQLARLMNDGDAFEQIAAEISDKGGASLRKELEWEQTLVQCQNQNSLSSLSKLYSRGKWSESFFIDLCLRAFADPSRKYLEDFPSVRNKRDLGQFDHRSIGFEFEIAEIIQSLYLPSIPMTKRLDDIGDALPKLFQLPTFETHLLVIVCLYRWTLRHSLDDFRQLIEEEYKYLTRELYERLPSGHPVWIEQANRAH